MNDSIIIDIMQQTLYTIALLAAPPLATLVFVGLSSQIIQTVTSLKDQALSFIPKMAVTGVVLLLLLPWYIVTLKNYFSIVFNYMGITKQ
ncbi:MAG: flagellar biosynthetic protein FliQ [Lentisphaeraceae bacterium]|nr:flagellar biosynthetic protein FliQ [Lentisphaeraceae bacterium]